MSIFASILRSVYKLSGAKKAFALPEDALRKEIELKAYLEQAGFYDVQIHKKKSWLCITAWK